MPDTNNYQEHVDSVPLPDKNKLFEQLNSEMQMTELKNARPTAPSYEETMASSYPVLPVESSTMHRFQQPMCQSAPRVFQQVQPSNLLFLLYFFSLSFSQEISTKNCFEIYFRSTRDCGTKSARWPKIDIVDLPIMQKTYFNQCGLRSEHKDSFDGITSMLIWV